MTKREKFAARHSELNRLAGIYREIYKYSPRKAAFYARVTYDQNCAKAKGKE